MSNCIHNYDFFFMEQKCPYCLLEAERDAALDQVANLEFQLAALEEKVRLLEAAQ